MREVAGHVAPNPGGVGPMTRAMLLANVVARRRAARRRRGAVGLSMTLPRPPLYVRRPFLAGLVRQLPLLAVLIAVGVGLVLVTFEHWRRGLVVIGIALLAAAALRLLLPVRRVGLARGPQPVGRRRPDGRVRAWP